MVESLTDTKACPACGSTYPSLTEICACGWDFRIQKCPDCGTINPPFANVCLCGWDFSTHESNKSVNALLSKDTASTGTLVQPTPQPDLSTEILRLRRLIRYPLGFGIIAAIYVVYLYVPAALNGSIQSKVLIGLFSLTGLIWALLLLREIVGYVILVAVGYWAISLIAGMPTSLAVIAGALIIASALRRK